MASIESLFTVERCNTPLRLPIGAAPKDGEEDNRQWIDILGTDSDAFREAETEAGRLVMEGKLKQADVHAWLISRIIVAWSFDNECNDENKFRLTKNSPSLAKQIDKIASAQADFTIPHYDSYANTPSGADGLTDQSAAKKTPSRAKPTTRK